MDLQKLLPELFPGIGKKEFFNGQIKPTQKAFIGPSFANIFDAIGNAAEGRLNLPASGFLRLRTGEGGAKECFC